MSALWWLILWAAAFGSFLLMFAGVHDTGETDGAGFLPINIYTVDPVCYCAGAVLSIAIFAVIWFLLMRRTVPLGRGWHPVWTVIWVIQVLLGLLGLLALYVVCMLMQTDLFSRLEPGFLEYFGFVYPITAALLILIDCNRTARVKKTEA